MAGDGADGVGGTAGADTLAGGGGGDLLVGRGGNDVLYGFGAADTDPDSGAVQVVRLASGLSAPLFAASPPGRPDVLFVVEKGTGRIQIMDVGDGSVRSTPFLDIPDSQLSTSGEQGLLGLAFHPEYATNGRFFVYLTNAQGDNEVRAYQRSASDPNVAEAASGDVILRIPHPTNTNHNGGWMGFGPDGLLYINTGDGGGGGDPNNNAQNTSSLLGKVLRIDVDGDDFAGDPLRDYAVPDGNPFADSPGADEVFAYGLRNPWRSSFDRLTGDLYIADVGQGRREEVNFVAAGTGAGANFGWKVKEGSLTYNDDVPGNPAPSDPSLIDPVAEYDHADPNGGRSITGGYAYRGPGGWQGQYVFADFITGRLWTLKVEYGATVDFTLRNAQLEVSGGVLNQIASFAEDGSGRLYAIGIDGEVFRFTPSAAAADGADRLRGGDGADSLYGGAGGDALYGEAGDDRLSGGREADRLFGGSEADRLFGDVGDDLLRGEAGDDVLTGGAGRDLLAGGSGADVFAFVALNDSRPAGPDRITDWEAGADRIDVSALDSGAASGAFTFIGSAAFSGTAGELRAVVGRSATQVLADTNGDKTADLLIVLAGPHALTEGDFIL